MDDAHLKQYYGDEYPAAVTLYGVQMPLVDDRRFAREYSSKEQKASTVVSKFYDGTASITADELRSEWDTWPQRDRHDFCMGCGWLAGQGDLPDMLRFVMQQPKSEHWSSVASAVALYLPTDEAFALLRSALAQMDCHTANITQGLALTKHPDAVALLREHLEELWWHPDLWGDDPFTNWIAFDATCCIAHLLSLGEAPIDYAPKVRALSKHVCADNRRSCGTFLHKYYDWLEKPPIPSPFKLPG